MTAALERVARLRDHLADVAPAPWPVDEDNYLCLATVSMPYLLGRARHKNMPGRRFMVSTPNDATAYHIARWNPDAARAALDLLAYLINSHTEALNYDGDQQPLGICDREPVGWPCSTYSAALAVLDALDGGETT